MPADVILDNPGDVHWFTNYGPLPVLGDCPHTCRHSLIQNIAWGPDHEHYTLNVCNSRDGCAGRCRGWYAKYPDRVGDRLHGFKQVRAERDTTEP